MFHRGLASLSLVLLALLSLTSAAQDYDALRDYQNIELGELQRQPQTYKNTEVKFQIYLHQVDEVWSPFFSPFSEGDYVNFSGWSANKHLWKKEEMIHDFPFLYIRNESESLDELVSANKYDILEIKGTVKSAFQSHPWIEVRHVDLIRRNGYTKKQLRYLILGQDANKNDQPTEATRYFEKGLKASQLTSHDQAEVLRQLAINYFEAQDYRNAIRSVTRYEDITGERDDLLRRVHKRSRELMKMSPEERNAKLKKEMKDQDKDSTEKTGHVPESKYSPNSNSPSLKTIYSNLRARHQQLRREHRALKKKHSSVKEKNNRLSKRVTKTEQQVQSLKEKKKELQQALSTARQKNARLLAQIRKKDHHSTTKNQQSVTADDKSEQQTTDSRTADSSSSEHARRSETNYNREKLLSRIRILKRRNQSLRSQVDTLSDQRTQAEREIQLLNEQVQLETSAVSDPSQDALQDQGS